MHKDVHCSITYNYAKLITTLFLYQWLDTDINYLIHILEYYIAIKMNKLMHISQ